MIRRIAAVIFEDYELLDLYGPIEMFGMLEDKFSIDLVAESLEPVKSSHGPRAIPDATFAGSMQYDILLIPGGRGTRREVDNPTIRNWIIKQSAHAEYITSVCTGSAILARTGLLDTKRATSNKHALKWVMRQGENVNWQARARWVEDGRFFTASGVSAGMDMALALIEKIYDTTLSEDVAKWAEYIWNRDKNSDPFYYDITTNQ